MADLYDKEGITLTTGARVQAVDIEGGRAVGVQYLTEDNTLQSAKGDLIVLGANAIFLLSDGEPGTRKGDKKLSKREVLGIVKGFAKEKYSGSPPVVNSICAPCVGPRANGPYWNWPWSRR